MSWWKFWVKKETAQEKIARYEKMYGPIRRTPDPWMEYQRKKAGEKT